MGTDAQMIIELSKNFFRRNNPVETWVKFITEQTQNLLTFKSKMKLLSYKHSLASEQLRKMESYVSSGSAYQNRGNRLDRAY